MGFDKSGHRGGGIDNPRVVTLPAGAVLMRLYKPVEFEGERAGDFGAWWFTPSEYRRICDNFGIDGRALIAGRSSGKSGFHGVLALLQEWYFGSSEQLAYVNAVRLLSPMLVCYGPGAPANDEGYRRTLKPIKLRDGAAARQVYVHKAWKFRDNFERLIKLKSNFPTDVYFGMPGGGPGMIAQARRLPFEA